MVLKLSSEGIMFTISMIRLIAQVFSDVVIFTEKFL